MDKENPKERNLVDQKDPSEEHCLNALRTELRISRKVCDHRQTCVRRRVVHFWSCCPLVFLYLFF